MTSLPPEASPRLDQFRAEVGKLKVREGRPEPERVSAVLGAIVVVIGIVIVVLAYNKSHNTQKPLDQGDAFLIGLLGVGVTVAGAVVWLRYSLSRWSRYWLLRLVYEDRAQTDRP